MKVIPTEFDLDLTKSAPGYVRGEGLHMSRIYTDYYKEADPKRYARPEDGSRDARMGLGLAFEEMLEGALRDRLSPDSGRPGELVEPEHGILYSPDLIIFNGVTRLGEIKLTWMSLREWPTEPTNGFPPQADKYLTQMKLYCRCLETPYARLYGFFVNGSYEYQNGGRPAARAWDIEFTRREMDEEWRTQMNFAKQRKLL